MSKELIKVTINEQEFEVEKGARLIDVCRENGFGIPAFCYYKDLALQASCRMCLVRIEKMPKLQTSCTITCTDGMIVTTQSDEIEKAQRGMVEFLLADRKSTRLNSSHANISYAVFCLKKKNTIA